MSVIGLDLGATKLSAAVFSDEGELLLKEVHSLNGRTGAEVGLLISRTLLNLIEKSQEDGEPVKAAGCCVPGIAWSESRKVWAPNIPGWEDYPLLEELQQVCEPKGITVAIDSDRACYILGEVWKGAAKGCRNAIFLAVGTGIGAGILVDGKILRGANDIAGAIGWLALDKPFQEKYSGVGCFEYNASGTGIVRVAKEMLAYDPGRSSRLRDLKESAITAIDVFRAYGNGDPLAMQALSQAVQYWGMTTANLVSLFNPEKIIFGGGVFGPAVQFLAAIADEARKWAQPISMKQVKLEPSALAGDAGLVGAGYLAILQLKA